MKIRKFVLNLSIFEVDSLASKGRSSQMHLDDCALTYKLESFSDTFLQLICYVEQLPYQKPRLYLEGQLQSLN